MKIVEAPPQVQEVVVKQEVPKVERVVERKPRREYRQVKPTYQYVQNTGFDGVSVLEWEVERQDRNMAQMARKVVEYSRTTRMGSIEIIESEASGEVEQYAIEMSSQAMAEFSDYEMNAMAGFIRD